MMEPCKKFDRSQQPAGPVDPANGAYPTDATPAAVECMAILSPRFIK